MQAQNRISDLGIIQQLIDEPHRFQFVQAVRILLRWLEREGMSYEQVLSDVLRFENSLSLHFPASEIESLDIPTTWQIDSRTQVVLTPGFFGLLGVCGALPLRTTERIEEARRWTGDGSAHAFVNLFSQRPTTHFFQAWAKNRLEHTLDVGGKDCQFQLLAALAGIQADTLAHQPDSNRDAIAYNAAILATRPVAGSSISRMLTRHFGVPIELEPFASAWIPIPERARSKLGGFVARLGHGATPGSRIRGRDICVRLNIGPLGQEEFERFLPNRPSSVALSKLIALFGLGNLRIAVRLILKPSCIQRAVLTSKADAARHLGWDAFLVGRSGRASRMSIDYLLPRPVRNSKRCT